MDRDLTDEKLTVGRNILDGGINKGRRWGKNGRSEERWERPQVGNLGLSPGIMGRPLGDFKVW